VSFDEKGATNFLDQIFKLWIEPECSRRNKQGALTGNIDIRRCLIRLPRDRGPIVEFNDEIHWVASLKILPGTAMQKGQPVHLYQVREVTAVKPPEMDGCRVPFVYLFHDGRAYTIVFDFSPSSKEDVLTNETKEEWRFSKIIAESLQRVLVERAVQIDNSIQLILRKHGYWPAPALLPYPLTKIAKDLSEGNIESAGNLLRDHCTPDLIESLSSKWWSLPPIAARKALIEEALAAHRQGHYRVSIHALLPHVEGIITDWVYTKVPKIKVPWSQESKTKKLRDLVLTDPPSTLTYQKIVESTIDFIVEGPVLETFKNWLAQINQAFPNRHVVGHGRYDDALFTEDNSIKLFLLIDTIYYIVATK